MNLFDGADLASPKCLILSGCCTCVLLILASVGILAGLTTSIGVSGVSQSDLPAAAPQRSGTSK